MKLNSKTLYSVKKGAEDTLSKTNKQQNTKKQPRKPNMSKWNFLKFPSERNVLTKAILVLLKKILIFNGIIFGNMAT